MRDAATQLALLVPKERLDPAVRAWAARARRRQVWGVGCSGGADSLALLLLLWAHWPERRRSLRVLHFNHRLRGAESGADLRFCRRACAGLGVTFFADAWRGRRQGASEAEAREARMKFFAKRARVVWLGHQQDDIAENLFMRLARGSGTGGLAAPRPVQIFADGRVHLRPLLGLKKAELTAALQAVGVRWREDSSNVTDNYFRNRVRRSVLPQWTQAAQRDALGGAALSRKLLEEDDAALETWTAQLDVLAQDGQLRLGRLRGRPRALWRRALHRWMARNCPKAAISRQAFEIILDSIEHGRCTRHSLGHNSFAAIDRRYLRLVNRPAKTAGFRRCAN